MEIRATFLFTLLHRINQIKYFMYSSKSKKFHHNFPDPAKATGTEEAIKMNLEKYVIK